MVLTFNKHSFLDAKVWLHNGHRTCTVVFHIILLLSCCFSGVVLASLGYSVLDPKVHGLLCAIAPLIVVKVTPKAQHPFGW